jgi:hypothetical protein
MAHCLDTAASCPARRPYAIKAEGEHTGQHTAHTEGGQNRLPFCRSLQGAHARIRFYPGLADAFPSPKKARFVCFVRQLGRCHSLTVVGLGESKSATNTHRAAARLRSTSLDIPGCRPSRPLPLRVAAPWLLAVGRPWPVQRCISQRSVRHTRTARTQHRAFRHAAAGKSTLRPFASAAACSGTSCLIHRRLLFPFRPSCAQVAFRVGPQPTNNAHYRERNGVETGAQAEDSATVAHPHCENSETRSAESISSIAHGRTKSALPSEGAGLRNGRWSAKQRDGKEARGNVRDASVKRRENRIERK